MKKSCATCGGKGSIPSGIMIVRPPVLNLLSQPDQFGPPVILVHPDRMADLKLMLTEIRESRIEADVGSFPVEVDENVPLTIPCRECSTPGPRRTGETGSPASPRR